MRGLVLGFILLTFGAVSAAFAQDAPASESPRPPAFLSAFRHGVSIDEVRSAAPNWRVVRDREDALQARFTAPVGNREFDFNLQFESGRLFSTRISSVTCLRDDGAPCMDRFLQLVDEVERAFGPLDEAPRDGQTLIQQVSRDSGTRIAVREYGGGRRVSASRRNPNVSAEAVFSAVDNMILCSVNATWRVSGDQLAEVLPSLELPPEIAAAEPINVTPSMRPDGAETTARAFPDRLCSTGSMVMSSCNALCSAMAICAVQWRGRRRAA